MIKKVLIEFFDGDEQLALNALSKINEIAERKKELREKQVLACKMPKRYTLASAILYENKSWTFSD